MAAVTKDGREVLRLNVTCQGRWRGDSWMGRKLVQIVLKSVCLGLAAPWGAETVPCAHCTHSHHPSIPVSYMLSVLKSYLGGLSSFESEY